MGKNQTTTKEAQSKGVCERIFKALKVSPAFRYFRRISTGRPQTHSPKSATNKSRVATTDHHRNDPAKATGFKLVVQNGSTIPLESKGQQNMIPLHEKDHNNLSFASNMVPVEYNHSSSVDITNNEYPVKNMAANVVHYINDGPKSVKSEEYSDTNRFSKYIDHVKNKMKTMSSFDDSDDDDSGVGRAPTRRDSFNDKVDQPLQVQDQGAA